MSPRSGSIKNLGSMAMARNRSALHKRHTEFDSSTSRRSFNLYISDNGQLVVLPRLLARLKEVAPPPRQAGRSSRPARSGGQVTG